MIVVLDTGCANIGSILSMSKKMGFDAIPTSNYKDIVSAQKIILPGVGHFDAGMQALRSLDMIDCLKEKVLIDKTPILGICLGMQLLCNSSEEGNSAGLGLIDADVKSFSSFINSDLKIPHMGWNNVNVVKKNPLINIEETTNRFYFVHSYFVQCNSPSDILTTTQYGIQFTSSFLKENIMGVQFHPEKSHKFGMNLLKNFSKI